MANDAPAPYITRTLGEINIPSYLELEKCFVLDEENF